MKTFKGDFDYFLNKVKNNEHFSLSRWGDGELMILENKFIDIISKGDGEFKHDPNSKSHLAMRDILMKSYTHKDDNYYIGIACHCCVGREKFEYMKNLSNQNENNLTWANIFVNSNYKYFLDEFLPTLKNKKTILVANQVGYKNYKSLPFNVDKYIPIEADAWVKNYNISDFLKNEITNNNMKDYIFLFAAGPFANILTYELWVHDKNNTYIDIGSTLDKMLGLQVTRRYLRGADTLNKVCLW